MTEFKEDKIISLLEQILSGVRDTNKILHDMERYSIIKAEDSAHKVDKFLNDVDTIKNNVNIIMKDRLGMV